MDKTVKNAFPSNLYRAEQVQQLDRVAIDDFNIPGIDLMENAGSAAFEAMRAQWPDAHSVVIYCGVGNNGGDGYIVARLAVATGYQVTVVQLGDQTRIKGDAKKALDKLNVAGVQLTTFNEQENVATNMDVVVDALLGTGLSGDVRGEWQTAIQHIDAAQHGNVLALDIPSGLHADTGRVLGCCVKADVTVTFIGMKQGLLSYYGPEHCGLLLFDDLQVPQAIYQTQIPSARHIKISDFHQVIKPRVKYAHKGMFGHVLLVGGNHGYAGAIRMAAQAAARSGAGLVSVATKERHVMSINMAQAELMCHGIKTSNQLHNLIAQADVIAIGPGLGTDKWALSLLDVVLQSNKPMVMDADALNLLARDPVSRDNWVITPHPGEAARLLGCSVEEIQHDRFIAARRLQEKFRGIAVLKGNGSIISDGSELSLCSAGNPGMASGGMGDVLTGVIAGLFAQKMSLTIAAQLGVCVHANAADLAAIQGERGMLASDLFPYIRQSLNIN